MMILEYYEKYGNFRDEIEIFILLFSCFETRSRLHIVILMFRDENEKLKLNFSRSSEKNLSQFSRDLARTRILADLWLTLPSAGVLHSVTVGQKINSFKIFNLIFFILNFNSF